jgi:hypothetical protein
MKFLRWTADLAELPPPIEAVYTEVDTRGDVHREVGVDGIGNVVYRKPSSDPKWGRDGLFYSIDLPAPAEEVSAERFDALWDDMAGAQRSSP